MNLISRINVFSGLGRGLLLLFCVFASLQAELPRGGAPAPIEFRHFPDRMHAFVWRNWNVVELDRLAQVLKTSPVNVAAAALSMGLPAYESPGQDSIRRNYINILRRNWHLLPYTQLLTLVDMTEKELASALMEDDFLWIKFGRLKPDCEPLFYRPPGAEARSKAEEIAATIRFHFGDEFQEAGEPRFQFVREMSRPLKPRFTVLDREENGLPADSNSTRPRFVYSYFGLYGDPLMNPDLTPFPDGLLERLSSVGVNGVWLHAVLRNLAPATEDFPEFGQGHETRLANLNRLIERAGRFGVGVYLYLNEPRAMPSEFFESRPESAGVTEHELTAFCMSEPRVQTWLSESLAHVFRRAPGLAGAFAITASENLTHCASHGRQAECPRCRDRDYDELIAESVRVIEQGVHSGNPNAAVIAWDWGWHGHSDASGVIRGLPESVWLMSVSEWAKPIERGGVRTQVGEYSLSTVGPGPRALAHWSLAERRGLKTIAKMQLNNSWELSSVPYLPVMNLVAEHCANLARQSVDGMMLSWTLGGYPSPNLELAHWFSLHPDSTPDEALDWLASRHYGEAGAAFARAAWTFFSEAFREYPYHVSAIYRCPVQYGPANLLYPEPTQYASTMTGMPYDDLTGWRGPYPPEIFAAQFEKLALQWEQGLEPLNKAVQACPAELREAAESELRFARAARIHFQSVANQTRFILLSDELLRMRKTDGSVKGDAKVREISELLDEEIRLAKELYALAKEDSRLGFEAANQYFYLPIDLAEKVINCEWMKTGWLQGFVKEGP